MEIPSESVLHKMHNDPVYKDMCTCTTVGGLDLIDRTVRWG